MKSGNAVLKSDYPTLHIFCQWIAKHKTGKLIGTKGNHKECSKINIEGKTGYLFYEETNLLDFFSVKETVHNANYNVNIPKSNIYNHLHIWEVF